MKKSLFFSLSLLLITSMASGQSEILSQVDSYTKQVCSDWRIPGLSLSIIKNDSLIWAKGYGVREMGSNVPVDEHSVYQIGSVSKSFTAAVMASLVDEGLVSWNDTVKNILPDLDMYDDYVEQNLLVKDLMTHKTGINGQAGTYIPNLGYEREDIYKMFAVLKPEYSFRNVYDYNNITFIIASNVIEKVTGKSWEENVMERILTPLGMHNTSLNKEGFVAAGDKATIPHDFWYVKDSMYVAPIYGEEQALHWLSVIGPAGGVCSDVVDLAKWAQFHLNMGKVDTTQVISRRNMNYLHRGQTIVSQDTSYIRLYGHCWFVEQNNRYKLFFHTGTTWGETAICAYVPELKLGLVALCNSEVTSSPRYAIMRRIIDLFLGDTLSELRDWNKEYLENWWSSERASYKKKEAREAEKEILPPIKKEKILCGHYTKEAPFGDAEVSMADGQLYITIGRYGWKHSLKQENGLQYSFRSDGHKFPVTFALDEKGKKVLSFEVDFGYGEDFGSWIKTK